MYIGGSNHGNADWMGCREYNDTTDEVEGENILEILPKCGTTTVNMLQNRHQRDTWQHCMVPKRHQLSNTCTTEFMEFEGP